LDSISYKGGEGISIGSRRLKEKDSDTKVKRSFIRKFVSKCFNLLVTTLLGLNILDTQCGFKLFRRRSARIVTIQHLERWSFECELFYIAGQKKIPVVEVPVTWREMEDDSKIKLFSDPIKMFRDILAIRILYFLGIWSLNDSLTQ